MPLILGGEQDMRVNIFYDTSLGARKNSRPLTVIVGELTPKSGAVFFQAFALTTVKTNTFHAELGGKQLLQCKQRLN